MICAKCGTNLPNEFRFCFKCGAVFSRSGETPEQTIELAKQQYALYQQIVSMKPSAEGAQGEPMVQAEPEKELVAGPEKELQAEPETETQIEPEEGPQTELEKGPQTELEKELQGESIQEIPVDSQQNAAQQSQQQVIPENAAAVAKTSDQPSQQQSQAIEQLQQAQLQQVLAIGQSQHEQPQATQFQQVQPQQEQLQAAQFQELQLQQAQSQPAQPQQLQSQQGQFQQPQQAPLQQGQFQQGQPLQAQPAQFQTTQPQQTQFQQPQQQQAQFQQPQQQQAQFQQMQQQAALQAQPQLQPQFQPQPQPQPQYQPQPQFQPQSQYQYQPQPQFAQPQAAPTAGGYPTQFAEPPKQGTSGLAITALVLGIVAISTSFLPFINNASFFIAIAGVIFAIAGIVATGKSKPKKGRGIAVASLLISIIAIAVVLATQSAFVSAFNSLRDGAKPATTTAQSAESQGPAQADYSSMAIGQSVTLDNGMTVAVVGVRKGLESYNGSHVTEVTVSYTNDGKSNESFNPLDWKTENADGVIGNMTFYQGSQNELSAGQLAPGGSVVGNIYFEGDAVRVHYYSNVLMQSRSSISWVVE